MLLVTKIYNYSRHRAKDSASSSDFKVDLPINLTLPHNTSFYITDVTIPVSWYTIEAGRNNIVYYRINGPAYTVLKTYMSESKISTITLAQAMADVMNAHYGCGVPGETVRVRFFASGNLTSNTITIYNSTQSFEILTDEQAGYLISSDQFTGLFPFNSINTVIEIQYQRWFKQPTLSNLALLFRFRFVICI